MATMATAARAAPTSRRPTVQLPAVKDYEQVDREILGTLQPTLGWFALLGDRDPLPAHRRVGVDLPDLTRASAPPATTRR